LIEQRGRAGKRKDRLAAVLSSGCQTIRPLPLQPCS